ncbi:MAG: family 16 glycosylhydrolase [Hyphomonadaceae bacterium]|nr:family 16 glycosylhydrolase [Hyphomonadaceae bacterium]
MSANLPPELQQAWTRVKQVSQRVWTDANAGARRAWTTVRDHAGRAWAGARKASSEGRTSAAQLWATASERTRNGLKHGWISFRDSWTKQDWLAGIKPLPPGMAGNLTAIAIVTGLVVTSLVYGDYHQRRIAEARMIPSGEHPSQQQPLPTPEPAPVPEPVTPPDPEAAPAPSAGPKFPQMGEAFVERFDGDELDGRWYVSDGWSNGDWMDNDWRASQISLGEHGATMTMEASPEGSEKPLASAEMKVQQDFRYGYFEIRMRVPRDPGIVTGVFTYAGQDGATRPHEIDIEILGRHTNMLEATIHENGKPTHKRIRLPFDAADGFHTYGFDWQPDAIRWYADGKMIHEERGPVVARMTRPQQFIIDLWATRALKEWVGPLNMSKAPWKLDIACVAYAPAYGSKSLCQ